MVSLKGFCVYFVSVYCHEFKTKRGKNLSGLSSQYLNLRRSVINQYLIAPAEP